jgi:hypothetical protein
MSISEPGYATSLVKAQTIKETRVWAWARQTRIGQKAKAVRKCQRELWSWATYRQASNLRVEQLAKSLAALGDCVSATANEPDPEAPIFLLATGWRSGSTLLQRVLVTDPDLLLWGEPLGEMTIISRITEMVGHFISERNLGLWKKQDAAGSSVLSESWIANLYPSRDDFRMALRSLFDRWLGHAARERRFARWGFKEVRMGASEASFLHWLYPNAKFIFLSRHPYDCYRSLADSGWGEVYDRYPETPVDSAVSFANHWNRLVLSWSELPAGFPCTYIKYEDLISGKVDFRKLELWLGIAIREGGALSAAVGGTSTRSQLSWYERMIIAREAGAGMRSLGYLS